MSVASDIPVFTPKPKTEKSKRKINIAVYSYGFEIVACPGCGVLFGAPTKLCDEKERTGAAIYCPNGHQGFWKKAPTDASEEPSFPRLANGGGK